MSMMASQINCVSFVYWTVFFRRRSKKTSNLYVTGLCGGNSPITGEFRAQRASNAENVPIWWHHHVTTSKQSTTKFFAYPMGYTWCTIQLFSQWTLMGVAIHDDVIKWKHFPCYWPFVPGIHRSPVNSPHKGQWQGAFMFSLICA